MSTATLPVPAPPTTPPPNPTTMTQQQVQQNILEHAMLLVVTRRWPPSYKTIKGAVIAEKTDTGVKETTADRSMYSSTKKLWNSIELKAIGSNETRLDEFLKHKATPVPFKKGHFLIADDLFTVVEAEFMAHLERREKLIDAFIEVYEKAIEDAKVLLGDQFNQRDYPTKDTIRGFFYFSWEYLNFGIADRLQTINKDVAERKEQEHQALIIKAGEAASNLLMEQAQQVFAHMVDRLTPVKDEETGEMKRKVFRDAMLDPVNDFLSTFDPRNLGNHEGLKTLVDKVKGMMNGVTVQSLKDNAELRQNLEKEMVDVKAAIDKMIMDQPLRAITLED